MKLNIFRQEEFFEEHEFSCRCMLALSGVQPLTHAELTAFVPDGPAPGLEVGYTPSAGFDELRTAVAEVYSQVGDLPGADRSGADRSNVLITVGAIEALLITTNLLIDPGDEAVCLWPSYQPLYELVTGAGGRVRFVRLEPDDGFRIDLDQVREAVTQKTKLVIINSPHNPTGQVVPAVDLRALAADLDRQGSYLMVDEVFREMWPDPEPSAWDGAPNVVVVGGLSKSYGLPGLRIGWLVADPALVVRARQYRKYTSLNPGALDQAWATAVLRKRDQILARTNALVHDGLKTALDWLGQHEDVFTINPPAGGGLMFPGLRLDEPTRDFCVRLVRETGVLLAPGSDCYQTEGHLRMGFATSELAEGLHQIDEFLRR